MTRLALVLLCALALIAPAAYAWDEDWGSPRATIISKQTAVTINTGAAKDTYLSGLHIGTALTGTCVLTGFADSDGAAQSFTLPIGSVGFKDFRGVLNDKGALTITCSTVGDDNFVMVLWRPKL